MDRHTLSASLVCTERNKMFFEIIVSVFIYGRGWEHVFKISPRERERENESWNSLLSLSRVRLRTTRHTIEV